METISNLLTRMYVMLVCTANDIKDSERGDTNFVSMLLIIGIVVVLAGLFLTVAKGAMGTITGMILDFINNL